MRATALPRPTSRMLLVCADAKRRAAGVKALNAAARALDNPYGIAFSACATADEACATARSDGLLQTVLIDEPPGGEPAARALVDALAALRPEVRLYLLTADVQAAATPHPAVSGVFNRDDADRRSAFRVLQAQLHDKARTPFYDALRDYVLRAKDAWHTPGHSSGDSLRLSPWVNDFHDFLGEHVWRADLSVSVDMLDSLLDPKGVIADAQALAAKAFGARRTYFATNGTSTANKVIFQTLLTPGDKLLLDRNCHKSVHHGVVLAGAMPVYMDSSVNRHYGLFGPVPKARLFEAIEAHPDAKAMVLTSCTYDGLRLDLPPVIAAAHARGIKVIIDEAWYAHARFHPLLRPTALEAGADYATQSTHKVLSAFSQASMIHVNDASFDEHMFRENFNMHASTSPQYTILASLDVGRKQAALEGFRLVDRSLQLAEQLRSHIDATGVFRALTLEDLLPDEVRDDGVLLDPTKITVDISGSGHTVAEFQQALFERFHIQVEKSTFNTVTLLLTIGTTPSKVARLVDAFQRLAAEAKAPRQLLRVPEPPHFSSIRVLPRDAFYSQGEYMPLLDEREAPNAALVGRVSADQIVPYPPGIPSLVPGQVIDAAALEFLVSLMKTHRRTDLHGVLAIGGLPHLRVMTTEEEAAPTTFRTR